MTPWDLLYAPALLPLGAAWLCSPRIRASLAARRRHPPPELPPGRRAWVHGASVGEILSAGPVLDALGKLGLEAVFSSNTPTGLEAAARAFPAVQAFAMPLDFSRPVAAAFDRVKPSLLVLIELEIWPQLLIEAECRGIPVVCVNARITEEAYRRYQRIARLIAPSFRRVALYLPQGEEHAERLTHLGVHAHRVRIIPNLKGASGVAARPAWIPEGTPLLVGGSTHAGEEATLIAAWQRTQGWRLLLAPRHPERFGEVAELLKARGIAFVRRSEMAAGQAWTVCLLDTVGELRSAFAASALAFVGGTLAPVGGHNVLEPALAGVPVLTGPHLDHVLEDAGRLEGLGGLVKADDAGEVSDAILRLSLDAQARRRMGEAARKGACPFVGTDLLVEALRPFAKAVCLIPFPSRIIGID